tara:strand:+ start:2086 stop:3423 length:1338 start_codon:yes stop_codon:yes gene_type:complete
MFTDNNEQKMHLTSKIMIGMLAGALIGFILRQVFPESVWVEDYLTNGLFHIIGTMFIACLKMLVVPLVLISLICGVSSLSDPSKLGSVGGKTIVFYLMTTAIAVTIAITFAIMIHPGDATLSVETSFAAKEAPSIGQILLDMIPTNPVKALSEGKMLQIIVFAIVFGFAISHVGSRGVRVAEFFQDLNEVVLRVVTLIMALAPYGIFGLIAKLVLSLGMDTFESVAKYFFTVLLVLFIQGLLVYPTLLKAFTGLSPSMFLRKMRDVQLFAFSTSSSNATLPATFQTLEHKMGVDNKVASFTLPLGATVNMDGTAIMQGVATVFIAQVYNQDLTVAEYLSVILTATLASVGTAGVPSVGLVTLAMVLQQVNLPVEGIALIIGVDRLLDMVRTAVNVTGDSVTTLVVATHEKEIDTKVFYDIDAGEKELDIEQFSGNQLKSKSKKKS